MVEFKDMLKAAILRRKRGGQNIRDLAAELDCAHSTLFQAAAGKIRPPMKHLESWSRLFDKPEERELFIRLGAATKLGDAADRVLSSTTSYAETDLQTQLDDALQQLAEARRTIASQNAELADLRARVAGSGDTALRELREMLDPDEANPPPSNNPRPSTVAGGSRRER